MLHISKEAQLLINFLRDSPHPGPVEIPGGLDWNYFVHLIEFHEVLPLIYQRINNNPNILPPDAFDHLKRKYFKLVIEQEERWKEFTRLTNLFSECDLQFFPFRGPILGMEAYGHYASRVYSDLDFLFGPEDLVTVDRILIESGYTREPGNELVEQVAAPKSGGTLNYNLWTKESKLRIHVENHWTVAKKELGVNFDINQTVLPPVIIDAQGVNIQVLSPEEHLLAFTIHHGVKDKWQTLKQVFDLGYFVRAKTDIDWNFVLDRATDLGIRRNLLAGFILSKTLVGLDYPPPVGIQIKKDKRVKYLSEKLLNKMFMKHRRDKPDYFFISVALRERTQDKIYLIMHRISRILSNHDKDREIIALPPSLDFLYFFVKPYRIVKNKSWNQ